MKAIVQDKYGSADVLELRAIDERSSPAVARTSGRLPVHSARVKRA